MTYVNNPIGQFNMYSRSTSNLTPNKSNDHINVILNEIQSFIFKRDAEETE